MCPWLLIPGAWCRYNWHKVSLKNQSSMLDLTVARGRICSQTSYIMNITRLTHMFEARHAPGNRKYMHEIIDTRVSKSRLQGQIATPVLMVQQNNKKGGDHSLPFCIWPELQWCQCVTTFLAESTPSLQMQHPTHEVPGGCMHMLKRGRLFSWPTCWKQRFKHQSSMPTAMHSPKESDILSIALHGFLCEKVVIRGPITSHVES